VLTPVAVPSDQEPNGWERLLAFFVSQEMEERGSTPAGAAQAALERVMLAWRSQFGNAEFPLSVGEPQRSSTPDLPGRIRTDDQRFWFILARVEDDRSLFPPEERITHEMLASMTEAYDPDFRRAALIFPNGGPSHDTGEFANFVPGHVQALETDGWFLWGLVGETFEGWLRFMVDWDGHAQRSIAWWPSLPELTGNPPYLRHVALLTGEAPGIPNMPHLEQWFMENNQVSSEDARVALEATTLQRSLDHIPSVERSIVMPDPIRTPANPDGTPPASEPIGTVDEIVAAVVEGVRTALTPTPPPTDPPANDGGDVAAVRAEMEQLRADLQARDERDQAREQERNASRIRERLDECVRQSRISPADRQSWERVLTSGGLTSEQVEAELTALSGRTPMRLAEQQETTLEVGDQRLAVPPHLRQRAGQPPIDPTTMQVLLQARQAASEESDPGRAHDRKRALIYQGLGEDLPATVN
jgi:hypothetical protein